MNNKYLEKIAYLSDLSTEHLNKRTQQLTMAAQSHAMRNYESNPEKTQSRMLRVRDRITNVNDSIHEREHFNTPAGKLRNAAGKLLGYHTIYHGTGKDRLPSILKEGLRPDMQGRSGDPQSLTAGNAYVSKNHGVAKVFSHSEESKARMRESLRESGAAVNAKSGKDIMKLMGKAETDGVVLKGHVPDHIMRKAKPDHFMPPDLAGKFHGSMVQEPIPGKYFGKTSLVRNLNPLSIAKYVKENPKRAKEGLHEIKSVVKGLLRRG